MITKNISIELWSKYHPEIFVVQGETSGRVFAITFLSHGVTLPLADKTVSVYDGELVALTILGDTALFAPTTALTRTVAFKIEKSGVILHSFDVTVTVLDSLAIPDKVFLTNLVENGNFVNTAGWGAAHGTGAVVDNTYTHTANGTQTYPYFSRALPASIIGHVYGATIMFRVTTADCLRLVLQYGNGSNLNPTEKVLNPVQNTWYQRTFVYTAINATTQLAIAHVYVSAAASNGKVMEVQYVSCIDLTAAGINPTQAEMTTIMAQFSNSWFNGTALAYLP